MTPKQVDRFWSKVEIKSEDECWVFKAYKGKDGYGAFGINQGVYPAHKVSFTLEIGPVPNGILVLHKCDNPPCCNPNHLFLGDQLTNMNDMKFKGRSTFGERSAKAVLTEQDVIYIKSVNGSRKRGTGYRALGKRFGVDRTTIREIVQGVNWNYLHKSSNTPVEHS